MQWYNRKTNELQSTSPWGAAYLHPDYQTEQFPDWQQVADTFRPPEPLNDKISTLRTRINAERDRREQGGFIYLDKRFDSDQTSVIRIGAAVNTAVAAVLSGTDFSVAWTTSDNSTVTLTAQEFLGLTAALAQHSNTQHIRARGIKEQLEVARTVEELVAVENLLAVWAEEV